jgi:hypothetical protein
MNTLNFNQSVGFPLETDILDSMQTAYSIFNALGAIAGEKSIILGCNTIGVNVSDGVIYLNGEVLRFVGGFAQETIIIQENITSLEFEDGNSNEVIKERFATFGTGTTSYPWADFKRGMPTIEIVAALLLKADKSVVDALLTLVGTMNTKLGGIQDGAQVNVKANWAEANPTSPAFIQNKPTVVTILRQGVAVLGDVSTTDQIKTVTFPTVGTNNYMVIGTMISNSSSFEKDNDVIWVIREKANNSFKIGLREVSDPIQNLSFEYILIPLA